MLTQDLKLIFCGDHFWVGIKMGLIRLYGAFYAELSCYKIERELKTVIGCDDHGLSLLSECPLLWGEV